MGALWNMEDKEKVSKAIREKGKLSTKSTQLDWQKFLMTEDNWVLSSKCWKEIIANLKCYTQLN